MTAPVTPVEVALFGALRAVRDTRPIALGSPVQQAVLTCLLLNAGRSIPTDTLIQDVWDRPPRSSSGLIRTHMSRLRGVLGSDVLATGRNGYRVSPDVVVTDHDGLVGAASRHRRAGDDDAVPALTALRTALAAAAGTPLLGVPGPFAERQRRRLESLRLDVHEQCLLAESRLGLHADVLVDGVALAQAHPLREGVVGAVAGALHALGRTAEALELYHATRRTLAEELGTDPGVELQMVYRALLQPAPRIGPSSGTDDAGRTRPARRRDLPAIGAAVIGREREMSRLRAAPAGSISLLDGMAGIGKSTLAVHVARERAAEFGDGQLFLDLRGHRHGARPLPVAQALDALLRSAGLVPPKPEIDVDERAAAWRAACAERRLVVVLDDAVDEAQVLPLLGGGLTHTIVTSRRRLSAVPCEVALSLAPLADDAASELLAAAAGRRGWLDDDDPALVTRMCGNLPLALAIAGARLRHRPTWTVDYLAQRLGNSDALLSELRPPVRDIRAALELSTASLDEASETVLRVLAVLPVRDLSVVAAAAALGVAATEADAVLEGLLDENLVTQVTPGRYGVHELMRSFLRGGAPVDEARVTAVLDHFVHAMLVATAADSAARRPLVPNAGVADPTLFAGLRDVSRARAWIDAESEVVFAVADFCLDRGDHDRAWQLLVAGTAYFDRHGLMTALTDRARRLLDAMTGPDDARGAAHLELSAALTAATSGQFPRATARLSRVLELTGRLLEESPSDELRGELLWLRGRAGAFRATTLLSLGRYGDAAQQLDIVRGEITDDGMVPIVELQLADLQLVLGRWEASAAAASRALDAAELLGDSRATILAQRARGDALCAGGELDQAERLLQRALVAADGFDGRFAALTRISLGAVSAARADARADMFFDEAARVLDDEPVGPDRVDLGLRRADADRQRGRRERAAAGYGEAGRLAEEAGLRRERAWALSGLAAVSDDPDVARECGERARAIFAELGVPDPIGRAVPAR